MNLIDFSSSFVSLLPAVIALTLAILTRRVLLSLGVGILLGAVLLNDMSITGTLAYVGASVSGVFIEDGGINSWNMSIVAFLILLGVITALLSVSGATLAFANWAMGKVKNRRGSQLLAAFLGVFIFIDDYFNSLAVGTVSRPVTDRYKVSRAKLAYILDSTAAPMCVLMPISSWGAYIMALMAGILASHGISEYTPLAAYVASIPMNFYALFALLMVFAVIYFDLNVGAMTRHEQQASDGDDQSKQESHELPMAIEGVQAKARDLITPIVVLIIATISFMVYTGGQALSADNKAFNIFAAFENTDVGMSLVYGGLVGLAMTLFTVIKRGIGFADISKAAINGAKSMLGAILILLFAWTIGTVIGDMKTGSYLSTLATGNIDIAWFPVLLFLLSGFMAFATGTSWGTFGIMLPIAGDMAAASDIALMLPMLSAVLAGSVFGDHCSPISDTTILSSTGARCNHIDHVATQLPYSLSIAAISAIGFIIIGFTGSSSLALLVTSLFFIGLIGLLRMICIEQSRSTALA
ncbi:Na+/H+ antiporter NhaC family protein [Thalassotalea sp. HSM 43]|uniref:Na+/H+ antiporter NhaC family protein n=1 Tax=Thalassotalea sp. HSM 43 TaxID=2552945 RepID=UPI001080A0C8|nr:Na+/H+ antiporter NhaC family protein [Thalassotalea sp. HSM 43]QBY02973.1 Na+/H+ antiporter NhaC family protein [Thalassotalea sp. HSM 43]